MRTTTRLLAAAMLGGVCLLGAGRLAPSAASAAPAVALADEDLVGKAVTVIFHDGRTVNGTLLADSATSVKILVQQFGMSAEAEYDKATILEIALDETATAADSDATEEDDAEPLPPTSNQSSDPNAATVYYVEFRGGLGRELAVSPLREIVKDVKSHQPDYLIIKVDMDFKVQNMDVKEYGHLFDQFSMMNDMVPVLTDDINLDRSWKKKPKLVFWVRKAMGGVAFLPFVSDTIFYTSDAKQGGVGYLDRLAEGVGDEVVRQKQRSLRLARAEGLAARGGHDPRIIRAMTWSSLTFSYSMVGGKPVIYQGNEGDHILTDDGIGDRADTMEDIVRGRGNDVLTLNAELAYNLGISDGTADSLEDVVRYLGIARNYKLVDHRAKRILDGWADGVSNAERNFRRLLRNYINVQVQGNYDERTRARGQQRNLLRQMKSILDRYGEAIDPYEIGNLPENWNQDLELMIQRIKNEQQADGPP